MRCLRLPLATLIVLASGLAQAQVVRHAFPAPARSQNTITISPVALFHQDVVGEVEIRVQPRWSVVGGFTARSEWSLAGDVSAVTLEAGGRYLLAGRGPQGVWVGPVAGAGMIEGTFPSGLLKRAAAVRCGVLTGGTWVPFGRLVLSAEVGLEYEHISVRDGRRRVGGDGVTPLARAAIGFLF